MVRSIPSAALDGGVRSCWCSWTCFTGSIVPAGVSEELTSFHRTCGVVEDYGIVSFVVLRFPEGINLNNSIAHIASLILGTWLFSLFCHNRKWTNNERKFGQVIQR